QGWGLSLSPESSNLSPLLSPDASRFTPRASRLTLHVFSAAVVFFVGCTSESPSLGEADRSASSVASLSPPTGSAPNQPPTIRSATILPNPILRSGTVSVRVEAEDPEDNAVTFGFQWFANGKPIPEQTGPTLSPTMLDRGDKVSVEVTPLDGHAAGPAYRTAPVKVANSPPAVKQVVLEPKELRIGKPLRAQVEGSDADRDEIRYTFEWWKNNELVSQGEEGSFQTTGLGRDDTIVVAVTPHDHDGPGERVYSQPLTITNTSPSITSTPPTALVAGRYVYAVTAQDPEGDPLTYSLETAPPGMTINEKTGQIQWQVTPDLTGPQEVRVVVNDGQDGSSFQDFALTLPAQNSNSK
ncbi:MAG: putative Ig domain-containing protein, partial [Nitrospirota bacterium]|nr:putative Ig domain-containing protein [Nitrospirota bacterium]